MRRGAKLAIVAAVELPAEPFRLALEIERGIEPLSGRLRPQAGDCLTFVGWTGLAAALTSALDADERARRGSISPTPPAHER
jgi:hypothetical protein